MSPRRSTCVLCDPRLYPDGGTACVWRALLLRCDTFVMVVVGVWARVRHRPSTAQSPACEGGGRVLSGCRLGRCSLGARLCAAVTPTTCLLWYRSNTISGFASGGCACGVRAWCGVCVSELLIVSTYGHGRVEKRDDLLVANRIAAFGERRQARRERRSRVPSGDSWRNGHLTKGAMGRALGGARERDEWRLRRSVGRSAE